MNQRKAHTSPSSPSPTLTAAAWIANAGLLLVLAGTAIPLFSHTMFLTARWIFSAGALLAFAGKLTGRLAAPADPAEPVRLTRMKRLEVWSAVMFVVAAVFMYLRNVGPTDWIAFTLAGGALTCYTSLMIPRLKAKQ